MASGLGLREPFGAACRERDIAYALVLSRAVRSAPKLATARWWASGDTTLGADPITAGPPGSFARHHRKSGHLTHHQDQASSD